MSATANPKTSAGRPPRGGPPIHTAFDGSQPPEGEPLNRRLSESVNRLLSTVDHTPVDRLPLLLRLLEQRRGWVQQELDWIRMLESKPLPRTLGWSLDFVIEAQSTDEAVYIRLMTALQNAIEQIQRKIAMRNSSFDPSDS